MHLFDWMGWPVFIVFRGRSVGVGEESVSCFGGVAKEEPARSC